MKKILVLFIALFFSGIRMQDKLVFRKRNYKIITYLGQGYIEIRKPHESGGEIIIRESLKKIDLTKILLMPDEEFEEFFNRLKNEKIGNVLQETFEEENGEKYKLVVDGKQRIAILTDLTRNKTYEFTFSEIADYIFTHSRSLKIAMKIEFSHDIYWVATLFQFKDIRNDLIRLKEKMS